MDDTNRYSNQERNWAIIRRTAITNTPFHFRRLFVRQHKRSLHFHDNADRLNVPFSVSQTMKLRPKQVKVGSWAVNPMLTLAVHFPSCFINT